MTGKTKQVYVRRGLNTNYDLKCLICGTRFKSSNSLEYGFKITRGNRISPFAAICPNCMEKGKETWPSILKERSEYLRTTVVADILRQSEEALALADCDFVMPSIDAIKREEGQSIKTS